MGTKLKKTFDINDQKQIFETIFHKSVDGILIIEDGIFVECNDSVVHMLKYKDKIQFLNTHPSELSPEFQPDGRSSFAAAEENTRIVLEKGSRSFEWVHKKADGQEFWVWVVLTNISTEDKTRFLVIWRDIDEKKKMEHELKELNETLEKKVEQRTKKLQKSSEIISKHVIYSKSDLDGNFTDVSEAFCKITGYYRDELIGRNHTILRHPDMPKSTYEDMWKTIKSGKSWIGKLKNIKKDGDYYWTVQVITPEFDEKGDIVSYMSIRDDVTSKLALRDLNDTLEEKIKIKTQDLKRLNENLEKRVKEAVEEAKEKELQLYEMSKMAQMGEMIENIAHQWRQPLGAISAVASSVSIKHTLDNLNTEDIPKYMQEIEDYTQYLSQTIDTFRNFIKDSKEFQEVVLQEYIDNTLYIIDSTIKANNIELIKEIDYLKSINISMILGELSQVIINIINNAKDILLEREIEHPWIKLELKEQNNKAIITIEDNAGGIPEDILPKIFEPYFTTKNKSHGTGLGLHMSYKIISQSLNGKLYAKNTDNGAKFFIELPL